MNGRDDNDDATHPKRAGSDLDIRRGNRGYQRIVDLAESRASCAFGYGSVTPPRPFDPIPSLAISGPLF